MMLLIENVAWYKIIVLKKKPINKVEKPADVNIAAILPPFTIPPSAITKRAKAVGGTR
jgi:hypothetical protein